MFEVETLKYATLATVSRCGMVWFSEEIMSYKMMFYHYLCRLRQDDYDVIPKLTDDDDKKKENKQEVIVTPEREVRNRCV
jgi:dynein heavy chain 1